MTIETSLPSAQRRNPTATQPVVPGLDEAFLYAIRPWASLKLTVVLFALAIVLILVGTLAQVSRDMWEVITLYFRSWICWIEASVFFPRSWFPDMSAAAMRTVVALLLLGGGLGVARRSRSWSWPPAGWLLAALGLVLAVQTVLTGGFWFPGGATVGTLLAINLLTAHTVRFKVQARGMRLAVGLFVIAAGAAATWLVIASGHSHEGLQAVPIFSWAALWLWCKLALVGLWLLNLGLLVAVFVKDSRRIIELAVLGIAAALLTVLSGWLWWAGDGAYLGDAGMRILWQLIQGGLAALVVLAGCVLVFKRRGGIVLIHAGLGLMMLGEWFVSWYAVEERLMIKEGETVNFAVDIRETELAAIDGSSSPTEDQVTAIPRSLLVRSVETGQSIQDPELPFDVQVVEYLKNSDLRRVRAEEKNPATAGSGLTWRAVELRAGSGADANSEVDMASAYVRLTDKVSGKPIGTYLVSQFLATPDGAERVSAGGKSYDLALRFKHTYKPYSMQLIDVRKDDYIGTSTPRNYSSDVKLLDPAHKIDRQIRIWMNNPLRYAGETFYQSGYHKDPQSGAETTTLQVVTNTGWMIPYVACMFVWLGLKAHFSGMLLRFLTRRDEALLSERGGEVVAATLATRAKEPEGRGRKRRRQQQAEREQAGRDQGATSRVAGVAMPVTVVLIFAAVLAYQARPAGPAKDGFDLAAFGVLPVVDQGRVKPIDSLARSNLAKISDRESFKDANDRSQPAVRWLLDMIAKPDAAEQHPVFRIHNLEVQQTLGLERRKGFRYSLGEIRSDADKLAKFDKELSAVRGVDTADMSFYQRKLVEVNNRFQTYMRLVSAFQPWDMPPFPSDEEMQKDRQAAVSGWISRVIAGGEQAEREMEANQAPLAVPRLGKSDEAAGAGPQKPWRAYATAYNRAYLQEKILGQGGDPAAMAWHEIFAAYGRDDAPAFNAAVAKYRELLAAQPPAEFVPGKVRAEAYLNGFAPSTMCIAMYWVAFLLAAIAWLGWSRPLNRAAFWLLLLAFLVHTAALIGRMYISGRPPVTNLYSSAVFISWSFALVGLAIEAIFRLGIGNVVAAVGGAVTLMVAQGLGKGVDTFTVMQAVLDTQFWLATHVVIVTFGYAATYVAGLLGIIYIAAGFFTRSLAADDTRRLLARMIYGIVCFAVLFSFIGTVLGGLWADDSWGRFWGWDPKENGALIIVLWNALILHAYWDKQVRERGLAVLAVGGNIVTSWSWFGVNELGVGLHSYGFTEGVLLTLGLFVASQIALMILGCLPTKWWASFRDVGEPVLAEITA